MQKLGIHNFITAHKAQINMYYSFQDSWYQDTGGVIPQICDDSNMNLTKDDIQILAA